MPPRKVKSPKEAVKDLAKSTPVKPRAPRKPSAKKAGGQSNPLPAVVEQPPSPIQQ